jgi:hypothetical protein
MKDAAAAEEEVAEAAPAGPSDNKLLTDILKALK